ncbi:MAG: DUF3105 domain-containing protein [Candidatus Rokubacteria bacterium]|nr:DUF3105 domain-containing protein [Candidatus Rokubacteria bacterium]
MSKRHAKGAKEPGGLRPNAGRPGRTETGWLAGRLTRRQRRRLGWTAGALAALLIAGAGGWLYARVREPLPGEFVPSLGNDHIATPESPRIPYNSDPPTSGPHLGYIAPWGVHTKPIPKELQVHNLEDAGVAVNYKPECADRVLELLRTIVARYADHVLLAPYPGLDRCIALTAWTRIDKLDQPDERRVVRFIEAYRGLDHHVAR